MTIKTRLGAQRYNERMDKMFNKYLKEKPYWEEYEKRVQGYEAQGICRSDAQSIVDVEFPKVETKP